MDTGLPWLVLGDFNTTLPEIDRIGRINLGGVDEYFVECTSDLNLRDIPFIGCSFT